METSAQFDWIRDIKNQGKEIKFMQEGMMCDYLHTELSMFLQPNIEWFNRSKKADFDSEPILVDYLNPNAEIIVWLNNVNNSYDTIYIGALRGYKFTPLLEIENGYIKNIPEYY